MRPRARVVLLFVVGTLLLVPFSSHPAPIEQTPFDVVQSLSANTRGRIDTHLATEIGAFDFVRATGERPLARIVSGTPEARAREFLSRYGALIGMSASERATLAGGSGRGSELRVSRVSTDEIGSTRVLFDQSYRGVPVFAGQVVVHLDRRGVVAVNGSFVPGVAVSVRPRTTTSAAIGAALGTLQKAYPGAALDARVLGSTIYRIGLVEGQPGRATLVRQVEVTGEGIEERVLVDANVGAVLLRLPQIHSARDRIIYTPVFAPKQPDLFAVQREGELENPVPMVANLYRFAGQVYDFFSNTFGRDSYDSKGASMRSVYLVNQNCPNAYWNGLSTNYCPAFDLDDVVAHEWGHAYTEFTHNLVYLCQSGGLNESYSDIWGETIDLLNGEDGVGGANNDQHFPDGQRWILGEDFTQTVQEAILRDMWDPERLGSPAKVSSENYTCGAGDGGGVHTLSGIPNHAYAMLVDGKTFNGVTVKGIGLTKAAHIYYRAMTTYQVVNTRFPQHEQALKAACQDLIGRPLKELMTGAASDQVIAPNDCVQVEAAARAVEFSKPASQCGFKPLLEAGPPPVCPGGQVFHTETFEDGLAGWKLGTEKTGGQATDADWRLVRSLPGGRRGAAAFAPDPNHGGGPATIHIDAHYWMDGPTFTIPKILDRVRLRFDHYVATERDFDGGSVAISLNGGEFTPLPAESYLFNAPNGELSFGGETQPAWSGADGGDVIGTWGTTVADLTDVVKAGDKVQLRFHFTRDVGSGLTGWFVDDVAVYDCPLLPAPIQLKLGSDYKTLDPDGVLTLTWKRPDGGVGPDVIQDCTSCIPFFTDDAESGLGKWVVSSHNGALRWAPSPKPAHDSTAFRAVIPDVVGLAGAVGVTGPATTEMTLKSPLKIPASGVTLLTFKDFNGSQPDDLGVVEVSLTGETWDLVYTAAPLGGVGSDIQGFQSAALETQIVDLTTYAGKTIRLRLRHTSGGVEYLGAVPTGWWVDDLAIQNENWNTLATVAGTSYKARLGAGAHSLRVRTAYTIRGARVAGDASAPVLATVAAGVVAPRRPAPAPAPDPDDLPRTGVGSPWGLGVAALGVAVALSAWLRRRPRTG